MDAKRSRKRIVKLLRRRARLVVVLALCAMMLASVVSLVLPKSYVVSARLLASPVDNLSQEDMLDRLKTADEDVRRESDLAGLVKGVGLDSKVAEAPESEREAMREKLVQELRESLAIELLPQSDATYHVLVQHTGRDPVAGVRIVAALSDAFQRRATDRSTTEQEKKVAGTAREEEAAKTANAEASAAHAKYREENGELLGGVNAKLIETQQELRELETQVAALEKQKRELDELLEKEPPFVMVKARQADPARIKELEEKIKDVNDGLTQLRVVQGLAEEHATVKALVIRLAQAEEEKQKLLDAAPLVEQRKPNDQYESVVKELRTAQSKLVAANVQRQRLRDQERDQKDLARRAPEIEAKEQALATAAEIAKKELDARTEAHAAAQKLLEELRSKGTVAVSQIEPPQEPHSPSGPGALVFAFAGLVLGASFGVGTAFVGGAMDRSFGDVEAVAHFLGIPTVGAVHLIQTPAEAAQARKLRRRELAGLAVLAVVAALVVLVALWEPQAIEDLVKSFSGAG